MIPVESFAGLMGGSNPADPIGDDAQPSWMTQEYFESTKEQLDHDCLENDDDEGNNMGADEDGDDDPSIVPLEGEASLQVSLHLSIYCSISKSLRLQHACLKLRSAPFAVFREMLSLTLLVTLHRGGSWRADKASV